MEFLGRITGGGGVIFFGVFEILFFFKVEPIAPSFALLETNVTFDARAFGYCLLPRKADGGEVEFGGEFLGNEAVESAIRCD